MAYIELIREYVSSVDMPIKTVLSQSCRTTLTLTFV